MWVLPTKCRTFHACPKQETIIKCITAITLNWFSCASYIEDFPMRKVPSSSAVYIFKKKPIMFKGNMMCLILSDYKVGKYIIALQLICLKWHTEYIMSISTYSSI